jgi:hypothetical protein
MITLCPFCQEGFKNQKKYNLHLAIKHESNPDGLPISTASIISLIKTKDKVEFLLRKIPNTRNSDMLLYLYVLRYWGQHLVYNDSNKLIQFKNPEGITFQEWIHLPSFETISRARRSVVRHYPELKPTDKIVAYRRAKEKGYKDYFISEKKYFETFRED